MAGKITALKPQKRAKSRLNVYLDDEFAFGLATINAVNLRIGTWLSDEEIAALKVADEVERAREKALDYLSYRPRSETELRSYLLERGFSEATIADVLQRLNRVGLVDDEAFARFWVENRDQFRPRGKRAMMQELRQKGVSRHHIENALEDYDEASAAQRVAQEQARRLGHLASDVFKRRFTQRMARRGFSYDIIRDILATYPLPNYNSEESEEL
jgi:regulatory protein